MIKIESLIQERKKGEWERGRGSSERRGRRGRKYANKNGVGSNLDGDKSQVRGSRWIKENIAKRLLVQVPFLQCH